MALGEHKVLLISKKIEQMMQITINLHEIVLMINYAWDNLLACFTSNKKLIAERIWKLLNRKLLTLPILHSTMTKLEQEEK